ncbi:hypothetical protein BZG36_01889 [Bifiguratus adelaidae]|uniref:Phosphoribulokinase/uridine kinase domain-containing protein n=1 Tax=Bifiguratus adelaidae TaxID=1938954 RepID=A0A261Y4H1_9FUNG|nr:hypothetical protein BZG36_01889 [Bifiguratus adelaidae]
MNPQGQMDRWVDHLITRLEQLAPEQRLVIAISGIPGSGKTTLTQRLAHDLNERLSTHPLSHSRALMLPMDGFHYPKAYLDTFKDPHLAHARRGAHWTFDPLGKDFLVLAQPVLGVTEPFLGLLALLKQLRHPINDQTPTIYAPSFDHAVGDPVPDDIAILPCHRLILLEGIYVHLNLEPWCDMVPLYDEMWFVDVDMDEARRRVIKRHIEAGLATNETDAANRWETNDGLNAQFILDHHAEPTRTLSSQAGFI